jgi:hypothetical protein
MSPTLRKVNTMAHFHGFDEESIFESDEIRDADFSDDGILFDSQERQIMAVDFKYGGEIRVELRLNGTRQADDSVEVHGHTKFFEGASDTTDDNDGEEDWKVVVPKDGTLVDSRHIVNQNDGGDFCDISMTFRNDQLHE